MSVLDLHALMGSRRQGTGPHTSGATFDYLAVSSLWTLLSRRRQRSTYQRKQKELSASGVGRVSQEDSIWLGPDARKSATSILPCCSHQHHDKVQFPHLMIIGSVNGDPFKHGRFRLGLRKGENDRYVSMKSPRFLRLTWARQPIVPSLPRQSQACPRTGRRSWKNLYLLFISLGGLR